MFLRSEGGHSSLSDDGADDQSLAYGATTGCTSSFSLPSHRASGKTENTTNATATQNCAIHNTINNKTSITHFLLSRLNAVNMDDACYSAILSDIQSRRPDIKKTPRNDALIKQLETIMTNSAWKSKHKKRRSAKRSVGIYSQIGQPYQILSSIKKLLYPDNQGQLVNQVRNDKNTKIFGCLCQENHENVGHSFCIQCDECSNWYCVTERCLGFNKDSFDELEHWNCWKGSCLINENKRKKQHDLMSLSRKKEKNNEKRGYKKKSSSAQSNIESKCAMRIQALYRGYKIRTRIRDEKAVLLNWNSILTLQKVARMWICRVQFLRFQCFIIKIQSLARRYLARKKNARTHVEDIWLVPTEVKYTHKFGLLINRSKDDVTTPLPRVLRVKHHTLLLYTKPVNRNGHFKTGLFAYYTGDARTFTLRQDIDIGLYGPTHKKTTALIMHVKSFLFNHSPMKYGQRYNLENQNNVFIDVTDDKTGDLLEPAKKNLLPYAKELTQDRKTLSKMKLKTHLRAVYDSNGSLRYVLCKGNRFNIDQECELFVSFESFVENNDGSCNNFDSIYTSATFKSLRVERKSEKCHMCLEIEGKKDERVPGYLSLRKQIGALIEDEVVEILDFLLANPSESIQIRFRTWWLVKQLHDYCSDLLFYCERVPTTIVSKIYRLLQLFPRTDGSDKDQDEKYITDNEYIGTFVRVNFRGGIVSGIVEDRANSRGSKEAKYLVKCLDTELLFLNEEEIDKCRFRSRFGHLSSLK